MLCIDKLKNNYHKPFEHIWCDLYCSFDENGDVCINSFKRREWQMYYTYYNKRLRISVPEIKDRLDKETRDDPNTLQYFMVEVTKRFKIKVLWGSWI